MGKSLKNSTDEQDAFLHELLLLIDDLYFKSFCMTDGDRCRMAREFFSPAPISLTGNYWPRYSNCDKSVPQTGSAYVTYLARPYFNYKTPSTYASKYGHSKYINIRKL